MRRAVIAGVLVSLAPPSSTKDIFPRAPTQDTVTRLVRQLGELPTLLSGPVPSDGRPDSVDQARRRLYSRIRSLSADVLPALAAGLTDPDVPHRRGVARVFHVSASSWYDRSQPVMDIHPVLAGLIGGLQDGDEHVRSFSAQAIGQIGPRAARAVPALVALLTDPEEGPRIGASIGLAGIGPAASEALPALRQVLADPSADVRRVAERAIRMIEAR
jgi:HEAT repeat protein